MFFFCSEHKKTFVICVMYYVLSGASMKENKIDGCTDFDLFYNVIYV